VPGRSADRHPVQRSSALPRILAHRRPSGRPPIRTHRGAAGFLPSNNIPFRELMAISSMRRSFLWWALAALPIVVLWIWWSGRPAPAAAPAAAAPVQVRTAMVAARDMPIRVQGLGAAQAWASVMVRARIDGQLESVGFREGEIVRQGQLIARLDDRTQKAQLAQAVAQRARDQAQLDNAREDLARYVELARHGAIDRKTLDTQRAQVAILQAAIQADEAQIQAAPLTGRTGPLKLDPRNLVRAADADGLVLTNKIDPMAVSFTVPDTAFAEVQAAVRAAGGAGGLAVEVYGRDQPELLGRGVLG